MIPGMPVIGVRFDIDKVESGGYGAACWRVLWRAITPEALGPVQLYEGDTAATLGRQENVFCIAVQTADAAAIARIKQALACSSEFRKVCAEPMFVEGSACLREPLPDAGRIDGAGNLVGEAGAARSALGQVRREQSAPPESTAQAASIPGRSKPASARTANLPPVSSFKEFEELLKPLFSTPEATWTYYLTAEELCDVVERYGDLMEVQFSEDSCPKSEDMAYIRLFQKNPPEGNPIEFIGMFPYASPGYAANGWQDEGDDPAFVKAFPRLAGIQGKWHLNFCKHFGNPRDITYERERDLPPGQLWAKLCARRNRLGLPGSSPTPGRKKPVKFTCTKCGKALQAADEAAGKRGKCPVCGAIITVPGQRVSQK